MATTNANGNITDMVSGEGKYTIIMATPYEDGLRKTLRRLLKQFGCMDEVIRQATPQIIAYMEDAIAGSDICTIIISAGKSDLSAISIFKSCIIGNLVLACSDTSETVIVQVMG